MLDTVHDRIEEEDRTEPEEAGVVARGGNTVSAGPDHATSRILMVAGGTGGHIFPALAVAEELRARSEQRELNSTCYEIEFLGTRRQLESKLIPAAGFRLSVVDAAGLKGIGGVRWLRNLLVLPRTAIEVAAILRNFRPRVVVGVGGTSQDR